ncbi:MAG: single-stranded DNA-binding protein [Candidatus Andersenbacteria bacterium]
MDLNKVMLIGRLTRDPESRTTPQGVTVTNFGLATSRVWKDAQGNQQNATEFHNIVAWRRLGEICAQYLSKGRQIYIEGHLQTRSWEGQEGKKQYRTEVVADNMIMLGSKGDSAGAPRAATEPAAVTPAPEPVAVGAPASDEEIRIEDIPF